MVNQVQLKLLENGALGIGFMLAKTMIVILPSAIPDVLNAVVGGTSSAIASLEKIQRGPQKGRWNFKIFGNTVRMDQCDVNALRSELTKLYAN